MDSKCHTLSENILFVYSRPSKDRMHDEQTHEDRATHCCTNHKVESRNISAKIAQQSIQSNHVYDILHN